MSDTTPSERSRELEEAAVLCYAEPGWAWFTTQSLEDQWGDDWDDAPWEHNAGRPYTPCWHREPEHRDNGLCECDLCERGWDGVNPRWEIYRVGWVGPYELPGEHEVNSRWSVKNINAGHIAWLNPSRYRHNPKVKPIPAGTRLVDFIDRVRYAKGEVYVSASHLARLEKQVEESNKLLLNAMREIDNCYCNHGEADEITERRLESIEAYFEKVDQERGTAARQALQDMEDG